MLRRVLCLLSAAALLPLPFSSSAMADAKDVFAGASPSIVVVLAENAKGEQQSQGSGVVIANGIAITNCHVVEDAATIKLQQAADERGAESYRMKAEVIAKDKDNDLCLLFAADLSAPPAAKTAAMGAAKSLSIGEEVYAIGAPQGLDLSLSRGIVAQLRGIKGKPPIIQTDAALSPGSSGGGLFNENSELVGITTFKRKGGENLNFAMPVENVAFLLKSFKNRNADIPTKLAYAADLYRTGNYEQAGRIYGEVLRDKPTNLQALRGSALSASGMHRYKEAADFYVRILEHFPEDPFAVAELANLGGINPAEVERILKSLLGKVPDIDGRLYFALGNVYASSLRWQKAHDAFSDALSREKNPDYAYNLAIALEYLYKPKLAVHYYKQALQMARGSATAGFDADMVRERIVVLDN